MSGTVKGTLPKVRDGSEDPQRDPRRVREHSRRYGTGQGTHVEVRDGSRYRQGGPGQVGGPSGRFETGWETLSEVLDPPEGLRWVRGPTQISGTGRGTLGEVGDE